MKLLIESGIFFENCRDVHCGLIGYQVPKKARPPLASSTSTQPPVASRKLAIANRSNGAPIITVVNSRAALSANFSQEGKKSI